MILLRQSLLFQLLLLWHIICIGSSVAQAAEEESSFNDDDDDEEYVRVMVGFRDRAESKDYVRAQRFQARTASGKPKTKINYQFQQTDAVAMEVTKAELEEMKRSKQFQYIEEDILVPVATSNISLDNTTAVRELFEFRSYGIELTQAQRTMNPDTTSDEQCIVHLCVVDSGVFLNNADIPYSRGDGYTDGQSFGAASGQDWANPRDTSHGTHVAGIMVATGGNDRGVTGVIPQGPQRSHVCLRVAKVVPDGEGVAFISALLEASEWCVEQAGDKPVVINLSFAVTTETSPERGVYQSLYDKGALLVAAAGNLGTSQVSFPAAHPSVISVASVNAGSSRSSFSQYNSFVELSAPGENIEVLRAESNEVVMSSGTSLASPFVAGLAARVWAAAPRCNNKEVRQALRDTARRLGSGVPNRYYGYGLIRARDAHDLLINANCNNSPSAQPSPSPSISPSQSPSIKCMEHLESCSMDSECCRGFICRRMSTSLDDSLVCRRDIAPNAADLFRPRLASMDDNVCRGGYGGGCHS